ncbi:MAG: hypothetical protein LBJ43_01535 [Propionibacteriaceae bacterium]|jgi:hypothetical protein|nr:hypothetical protein [Propionibacteriaceae bacterium]
MIEFIFSRLRRELEPHDSSMFAELNDTAPVRFLKSDRGDRGKVTAVHRHYEVFATVRPIGGRIPAES